MTAPPLPALTEDCSRCAALCCLALAFDKSTSFAIDKPAGTPCPMLSHHLCSIHQDLDEKGFQGCIRYSCTGAGQRVVQELYQGRSWQDDPALTRPMIDSFRGMRAVQDRIAQLSAAAALPLPADVEATRQALLAPLLPGTLTLADTDAFPGAPLDRRIATFLTGLRPYVGS